MLDLYRIVMSVVISTLFFGVANVLSVDRWSATPQHSYGVACIYGSHASVVPRIYPLIEVV